MRTVSRKAPAKRIALPCPMRPCSCRPRTVQEEHAILYEIEWLVDWLGGIILDQREQIFRLELALRFSRERVLRELLRREQEENGL
jgi:hypothetical protein